MRICVIGEGMIELSGAEGSWQISFGGDTLNTAIHLARFGRHVQYFTALGDDRFSADMKAAWTKQGVDVSLVLTAPDRSPGLYAIATDEKGERTFTYWRGESAARRMFDLAGAARASECAAGADLIVFSLISLAILPPASRVALLDLCRAARARGTRIAFDGNYRPRLWSDANKAREWRDKAIALCDIGLPTLSDEMLLQGEPGISAAEVARLWGAPQCEIVVKLGAEGCLLPDGALSPPPPLSTVVDTSGAGDAFNAGYLHARLNGAAPSEAAARGHRLAGWVIARRGAIPARDAEAPYASA